MFVLKSGCGTGPVHMLSRHKNCAVKGTPLPGNAAKLAALPGRGFPADSNDRPLYKPESASQGKAVLCGFSLLPGCKFCIIGIGNP